MILQQTNNGIISLITWDWKEDPNWVEVLDAIDRIKKAGYNPKIFPVETNSDESAIIVAYDTMPREEAKKIFDNQETFFNWD